MAYYGKDDEPMYYTDGTPCNDSARREGPPSWAPQRVKDRHRAIERIIKREEELEWLRRK
jgi:hypothetical protein